VQSEKVKAIGVSSDWAAVTWRTDYGSGSWLVQVPGGMRSEGDDDLTVFDSSSRQGFMIC